MKVLFVVDSLSYGGAGRVVSILASQLAEMGFEISIAIMGQDVNRTQEIYAVDYRVNRFYINEFGKVTSWKTNIKFLRYCLKKFKPDICIPFLNMYAEYAVIACLFSNIKVVACERNDPHYSPEAKIYRLLRNPLYSLADKVICQTQDMVDYFPKHIRNKSRIILNPINTSLPEPYVGKREKRIVAVGKLGKQKNFSMAIDSFALIQSDIREYCLEIYGEGTLRAELEKQIEDAGLSNRVFLMGQSDNLFNDIKSAELFIMTSDYEGMSNALIEAMALGLPCISTNHPIGGAKTLIENGINGVLVPVNDAKEMANAIKKVINDPVTAKRMSENAVKIRDRLSIENIAQQWKQLLLELT